MTDRPPILDRLRWQALSARLDDLAAARRELAAACAAIRAPVDTIDRLWRDALPALRGDVLAAERLAALVAAAIPAAALVETARAAAELARKTKLAEDHEPGLIRIGELAVLAVAAARVAPAGLVAMYAATIHGLALQAAPAEILAQLEPHGPPRDTLGDLVARLVPHAIASGAADRLVLERFIYERFELGRWHCLDRAFAALGFEHSEPATGAAGATDLSGWSPATADRITGVERSTSGTVALFGAFAWGESDEPVVLGATAVVDGDGAPAVAVEPGTVTLVTSEQIAATFDGPIEWAGYAVQSGVDRAQVLRDQVRKRITEIAGQACVDDDRLPALIPDVPPLAAMTEAPPRRAGNAVAGMPAVTAWLTPTTIRAGDAVTLAWRSDGAGVRITPPDGKPTTAPAEGTRSFTLDMPGTAVFEIVAIDGELASPARSLAVVVTPRDDTTGGSDTRDGGEPGERGRVLPFIVFRPHVLDRDGGTDRVTRERAQAVVDGAARLFGATAELVELPWVEDALAVIASPLRGTDDPRITLLLEELDRAAARTPHRERAIWIALVPDNDDRARVASAVRPETALGVARPGEAALAVVVASAIGTAIALAELIQRLVATSELGSLVAPALESRKLSSAAAIAIASTAGRGTAERLRIVGMLDGDTVRLIDTPRLDDPRAAGPGAPHELGVVAICRDPAGRELARTPIRGHRTTTAAFVALVAITDDVAAIELTRGHRTALRIERPGSSPALAALESRIDGGRLSLRWTLAAGSAREAVLEVAAIESDDWVPITTLAACRERNIAPTWRLPQNIVLRVIATDGWNVAVSPDPIQVGDDVQSGPFVIRRVSDRELWAELPDGSEPATTSWRAPPGAIVRDRVVTLPPAARGDVELRVTGVVDSLPIGSLDGQRRD